MKFTFLFISLALAARAVAAEIHNLPAAAVTPPPPAIDRATQDFAQLMEMLKAYDRPADLNGTPAQRVRADEARFRHVQQLLLDYLAANPPSPQRWHLVVILRRSTPQFVQEILPAYDAHPVPENLMFNYAAKETRIRLIGALEQAMLTAPDVPPNLSLSKYRPLFLARKVDDEITFARGKSVTEINWASLENEIDAFARQFPEQREAVWLEESYLTLLATKRPEAVSPRLQHSFQSVSKEVRQLVEGRMRIETARREPLNLKFTALDGREVDLATLRSKVVLIDFWATWCGPCLEELPNVKSVYEKYHDRGFEVIGVALDSEADRRKLSQLIDRENLPWPQFFDGKKWKSSLAQQFSVSSIPTTLLLGLDGRLVSTAARGPALEAEVKRLLSL